MDQYSILVVAGTAILRLGIRNMLAEEPDIVVVGEAADRASLRTQLLEQATNVVIVCPDRDLELSVTEATALVKALQPSNKVLLLELEEQPERVGPRIIAGVDAYLPFNLDQAALAKAVRDVLNYGLIVAEKVAPVIRKQLAAIPAITLPLEITNREREILQLLARRFNNQQIAASLCISRHTVKTHLQHLHRKLGIADRPGLIALAVQAGLSAAIEAGRGKG